MNHHFTNCRSSQGLGDFLLRLFAIIAFALLFAATNGCVTYAKVGAIKEDGSRSVRIIGWNASVEFDGVKVDNKFEPLKGMDLKK